MKLRSSQLALLIAFSLLMGDFAYRTWTAPAVPEYQVSSTEAPLRVPAELAANKHLYLRRTVTLAESADYAWLQVIGHDAVQVFVNGQQVGQTARVGSGRVGATLLDITSNLRQGKNTVAIHARQLIRDRLPQVSIEGQCLFAHAEPISFDGGEGWLASNLYDRRGMFWYEVDYPDEHWAAADAGDPVDWTAQVDVPPGAIKTPRTATWIAPAAASSTSATFATTFELPQSPSASWLRVASTGPYRLAVNGWMVVDDRLQLSTTPENQVVEQTLDLTALLRPGTNTISLAVSEAGVVPRIEGELVATCGDEEIHLATDKSWKSSADIAPTWMQPDLNSNQWQSCREEVGNGGVVPRSIQRQFNAYQRPTLLSLLASAKWLAIVLGMAVVAVVGCTAVQQAIHAIRSESERPLPGSLSYWALLPSTALAAAAGLMTWDLAWTSHDVYQPIYLWGLLTLVLVLWLGLYVLAAWRPTSQTTTSAEGLPANSSGRIAFITCWVLLIALAGWLRTAWILAEPMHHDEVSAYRFTMSIFDHGFPTIQAHEDLPRSYCSTSELVYYCNAVAAMVIDEPRLVIRVPAVLWSMATLLLIGYAGTKWFNAYVGLIAGLLYAVSPHVIGMSNFGRYLCQVQFFTLLTTYLAFEAVRGTGKLRKGYVWAAALSFVAMYLSWEGSGLYGVGLALAALLHRRRHLKGILLTPAVYPAVVLVVLVVALQNGHRIFQQTHRLWYGTGISSMKLEPMWRFPFFDADYFLVNSSWTRDAFLPIATVVVALILAFKHRWRLPIRFLLVCLLTNAGLMAALLPLRTNRYSFHLVEIVILLAGVVLVAMVDSLYRTVREIRYPALRVYAHTIATISLVVLLVAFSGWAIDASEFGGYRVPAQAVGKLRSPDWEEPSRFVQANYQPGDVVISILPHTQNFQFAAIALEDGTKPIDVDYWLETRLVLQAAIGDTDEVPRDRRSGAVMLYNLQQIEQLFAEHDRIWYCTNRFGQSQINDSVVSKFVREHMDVVYEDLATSVLLRDKNHRTAAVRLDEQNAGSLASEFYLE